MVDTSDVFKGIDPYVFWILGPGKHYFFLPGRGKQWLPLLIRLKEKDSFGNRITAKSFAEGEHLSERRRQAWQDAIQVPTLFTESRIGANEGPYVTALMSVDYIGKDFVEDPDLRAEIRGAVESVSPSRPLDAAALPPSQGALQPEAAPLKKESLETTADVALPEGSVIMGIIDDGIAFAHERFRKIVGGVIESRVEHWWLQDGPYKPNHFPFLPSGSQDVPSGCELNKRQINDLLKDCTKGGIVDEDLVYRKAKLTDFPAGGHKSAAWRVAHGTHVMDLACGAKPNPPCNDRPIICVQLPIRVTADTSGGHLFKYVVEAIWYILDRASTIPGAAHAPVVINLSYGRFEGPHDGTADIEFAIEVIIAAMSVLGVRLRVCLPAGNSYLSRTHAKIKFAHLNDVVTLPWRVLPDDRTPSFAEIWLPKRNSGGSNRINVTITAPTGESHTVGEGGFAQWTGGGGPVYAEVRYYISPLTNRRMFRISVLATTDLDSTAPLAPAGIWRIDLQNVKLAHNQAVHAWVQRDDSLYGFPLRGRQSFFDDPEYVRFDNAGRDKETDDTASQVKRKSTINAMATGKSPIVVGGYLRKEMVAAKYSSSGARRPPPRRPDAMAVSEDSRVHSGILAAGSHSGSVVAMGGTSVATPQIARFAADNLAAGGKGDRKAVKLRAALDELGYPLGTPPKPPRRRGGAGRVKIAALVKLKRYD